MYTAKVQHIKDTREYLLAIMRKRWNVLTDEFLLKLFGENTWGINKSQIPNFKRMMLDRQNHDLFFKILNDVSNGRYSYKPLFFFFVSKAKI